MSIYGEAPALDAQLPPTFMYAQQPYGRYKLGQLKLVMMAGYQGVQYPALQGVVLEGNTRSYLAGHTSDRSAVGQTMTVYGIAQREIDAGEAVRVAM